MFDIIIYFTMIVSFHHIVYNRMIDYKIIINSIISIFTLENDVGGCPLIPFVGYENPNGPFHFSLGHQTFCLKFK